MADEETTEETPARPTDQELMDKRNAELDADRENHNEKTGGGKYPLSTER